MKIVLKVENIIERGENAEYKHFLFLPQCFEEASPSGSVKVSFMWLRDDHF
jgi:hypothetical protein